jgi:primary-amine oxidase
MLDRLKQVTQHVTGTLPAPHPFDPLSSSEIEAAVAIISKEHEGLYYNTVTLHEPRKAQMLSWLADPSHTNKPHRVADVVAIAKGGKVYEGLVDLEEKKTVKWESIEGVQPLVGNTRLLNRLENSIGHRLLWKTSRSSNIYAVWIRKSLSNVES